MNLADAILDTLKQFNINVLIIERVFLVYTYNYNDTTICYWTYGDGRPMLIIHGWAIDHRFMENALEPIFEKYSMPIKRIYVDLPGMGLSQAGSIKNGDGMVEALGNFMNDLFPNDSLFLCGNSFGSVVCRGITARYTEKVAGMILIAPAKDRYDKNAKLPECGVYTEDVDFVRSLPKEEERAFLYMHANHTREVYDRYMTMVKPSIIINQDNDFLHKTLKGTFGMDINKMIYKNHFEGPVLLMTGKYDMAVGYEEQKDWLKYFNDASYVVIDGAGHNINVDQPKAFEEAYVSFIKKKFL